MIENVWSCPICKSTPEHHHFFARVASKWWNGQNTIIPATYAICDECGLVFLWDRLTTEGAEKYYRDGAYRTNVQGTPNITDRVLNEQTKRAEYLLPYVDEEPKRVLDIGASTGVWLDVLQTRFDCEVLGIEPSEHFRNQSDVPMFSELELIATPEYLGSFDYCTVIHTLEHLNDPVGFLVSLHEFTGTVLIEVPHLYYESCFTISHPICFTPETLTTTLKLAGWGIEWMQNYYGFKEERTNPPNILVKAVTGRVDEIIVKPDLKTIFAEYMAGAAGLEKDRKEWEEAHAKRM